MAYLNRRQFFQASSGSAAVSLMATPAMAKPDTASSQFRLGMVTYNIAATWDISTIIRVCQTVGLSPVELRTTHKHGVEPSLSAGQRQEVKKRFADAGIDIWGCGTVCEFHSPDPMVVRKNIETCKSFVQLVADIGGRGVKVRPNGVARGGPVEKTLEQIGKALIPCGQAAADAGVEIWLEVHGAVTAHPPHIHTIMKHCGHPKVGLTWNSNPTDVRDGSVATAFNLLRPWIKSCHINEFYSGYPYRELFRLLSDSGYDRVTLAEIQGMPDPGSGERLLRYYKAFWRELNR